MDALAAAALANDAQHIPFINTVGDAIDCMDNAIIGVEGNSQIFNF